MPEWISLLPNIGLQWNACLQVLVDSMGTLAQKRGQKTRNESIWKATMKQP
jgi:hypothetical protein